MKTNRNQHSRGFTLVEAMTVASLGAVFFGLVIVSLGRARTASMDLRCKSQLQEVLTAARHYAFDHDRLPPLTYSWTPGANQGGVILLHSKPKFAKVSGWECFDDEKLICPSDPEPETVEVKQTDGSVVEKPVSYGVNLDFLIRNMRVSTVRDPSDVAIFFDGSPSLKGAVKNTQGPYQGTDAFRLNALEKRHDHTANVVFLDGHVQTVDELTLNQVLAAGSAPLTGPGGGGPGGGPGKTGKGKGK